MKGTNAMRTIEEIRADLDLALEEIVAGQQRQADLRAELVKTQIQYGKDNPHPWAGKRVKRPAGTWDRAAFGIVTLGHGAYGKKGHRGEAGEWLVRSESGKTQYKLTSAWELAE